MTDEEAKKMLKAKLECLKRDTSGTDIDCNYRNCDECNLCYEQGTMGEQKEALGFAIKALEQTEIWNATTKDRQIIVPKGTFQKIWEDEQQPCEDCISRQAVLDAIDNIDWYHISNKGELVQGANKQTMPLYKAADIFYAIDALPSVTPQQTSWIPVSESLPEEYNHVLCQFCMGGMAECYYAHNFFHVVGGVRVNSDEVIAWMPLPSPYKAESENEGS